MSNLGLSLKSLKPPRASRLCSSTQAPRWSTRRLHLRSPLKYRIDEGLGEFLPPPALKTVAVDYQQGLLQRLNEEVRGTKFEGMSVIDTITSTAADTSNVLMFNYASLALNNHFFLEQLKPPPKNEDSPPNHEHEISTNLSAQIRGAHGSIAQLKSSFSAAAMGMFTSGWVWFVTDKNGSTGVIPTFGPGTLLVRSRSYMGHRSNFTYDSDLLQFDRGEPLSADDPYASEYQAELLKEYAENVRKGEIEDTDGYLASESSVPPEEAPTAPSQSPISRPPPPGVAPSSPTSGLSGSSTPPSPKGLGPRFLHTSSLRADENFATPNSIYGVHQAASSEVRPQTHSDLFKMGDTLFPLFAVSVNEHAWMSAGYGVWGKEEWLKQFWTVVDWKKVSEAYGHFLGQRTER